MLSNAIDAIFYLFVGEKKKRSKLLIFFVCFQATVRMVINYKRTQKTILRVNPRVPLAEFLPAICEKCEFNTETTVLLRDVQSLTPLDLSSSLNDYAIREVYAKDTKGKNAVKHFQFHIVLLIIYPICLLFAYAACLCTECRSCWFCRATGFSRAPSLTNLRRYSHARAGCFLSA